MNGEYIMPSFLNGARIRRLKLNDFRSYPSLDISFSSSLIAFYGENGAGKTNILEAISLLTPGRGIRRSQLTNFPKKNSSGGFSVFAEIEDIFSQDLDAIDDNITLATALMPGSLQREARINREPTSSINNFLEYIAILWLTPDQDGLFRGSAGDRRRFLDRLVLVIDKSHGTRVNAFENALRHRNRLLEESELSSRWLDAIELEIVELGVALAAARVETVTRLSELTSKGKNDNNLFPQALLQMKGDIEERLSTEPATIVEDYYRKLLRDNRARDRAAGRTLIGPQSADLIVTHADKGEDAANCSTGEQKALLIGLILAQARLIAQMRGSAPILLLDEVAAHLDPIRREGLFSQLISLGGQTFMTGTDPILFESMPEFSQRFIVKDGLVSEAKNQI